MTMTIHTDHITDEVPADATVKAEVSKSINMISARFHAQQIANSMNVAYYLDVHKPSSAVYHVGLAEDEFHLLAKYMGYRVEKIEEPTVETTEAA
jgi:hypothetical protein